MLRKSPIPKNPHGAPPWADPVPNEIQIESPLGPTPNLRSRSAWHEQSHNDPRQNSDANIGREREWQEDTPTQIAPRSRCRKRPQALTVPESLLKNVEKCGHKGPLAKSASAPSLHKPIHRDNLQLPRSYAKLTKGSIPSFLF